MPSFLFPAFLIGVAAAAVPVVLHLMRNQQAPEIRFSAIRLLHGVRVEDAARRHLHDRLLLAVRMTALCLLAIAFARPYFARAASGSTDAVVIAIDRSASMSAEGIWPRAVAAARRALDEAPRGARVGLVAFDTRADLLVEPTFDRAAVRAAIDRLAPGSGSTFYRSGITRGVSALGDRGRIVVVSDLQGNPADVNSAIPDTVQIDVRSVGSRWSNVALLALRRDDKGLVATIRNDSDRPQHAMAVASVDQHQVDRREADLSPGETRELSFGVSTVNGSVAEVALTGHDALTGDDRRYIALDSTSTTRVLLAGERGGANGFYLRAALNAADGSPDFDARAIGTDRLAEQVLSLRPDVVAIVSPRGLSRADTDALGAWTQRGGGLLVGVGADADDNILAPLVSGLRFVADRSGDQAVFLGEFESRHPLFQQLGPMATALSAARFTKAWHVDASGWDTIARFGDGRGAMFERRWGRGRVLVLASDLDRAWNDLPLQPAFVPLIQAIVRYLAPDRERTEFTPETAPDGLANRPGIVQLASGRHAAINLDPRESDPARMTPNAFDAAIRRTASASTTDARSHAIAQEAGQSLWRYGFAVMLAMLLVESLLASPARPKRRSAA